MDFDGLEVDSAVADFDGFNSLVFRDPALNLECGLIHFAEEEGINGHNLFSEVAERDAVCGVYGEDAEEDGARGRGHREHAPEITVRVVQVRGERGVFLRASDRPGVAASDHVNEDDTEGPDIRNRVKERSCFGVAPDTFCGSGEWRVAIMTADVAYPG